jgi:preprotein translocase SecE subunit
MRKVLKGTLAKASKLNSKVSSSRRSVSNKSKAVLKAEPFVLKSNKHEDDHFLNKRRSLVPKFARGAREELDKVVWPTRKQSISLTTAVYIFAGIFMIFASTADWGFAKLAERIFLK